jgi:Zn-dependent peptidase ImmA (M78 family)
MTSMAHITSISPERIAWCCHQLDITPDELATQVGLPAERFTVQGLHNPGLTFTQLSEVAKFLGRGVLFFTESSAPVETDRATAAQFRTFENNPPELSLRIKQLVDRVQRQRQIHLHLIEDLEDEAWPMFEPPALKRNDITEAARQTRRWLGLQDRNNYESYRRAVEQRGILVFGPHGYAGPWQLSEDHPVAGFALYDRQCPVIVVKKTQSESRRCFTLMHELAHVLLHRSSWIDVQADLMRHDVTHEREANQFAGLVLVPPEFLQEIDLRDLPEAVDQYDAYFKAHTLRWGVSTEVILRRLLDERRLSLQRYEAYRNRPVDVDREEKQGGSRIYRHREPRHLFGERYVRAVLDSLSAQTITLTKASAYLDHISVMDVHKLEEFCAHPHP